MLDQIQYDTVDALADIAQEIKDDVNSGRYGDAVVKLGFLSPISKHLSESLKVSMIIDIREQHMQSEAFDELRERAEQMFGDDVLSANGGQYL